MNRAEATRLARLAVQRQKERAKSVMRDIATSTKNSVILANEFARAQMLDAMTEAERQEFLAKERQGK